MGKEEIVNRILSDAQTEATELVQGGELRAQTIVAEAENAAAELKRETEEEVALRAKAIADGKSASARLDSAKILLGEKRRVVEEIYAQALKSLLSMSERDTLLLVEKLLKEYAEEGDEIVFAHGFAYTAGAERLPVVKEKKLTVSPERADIGGGFLLRGKSCDKNLSYLALLAADREENQAALAEKLFKGN